MPSAPPYSSLRDRLHLLAEETLRGTEIVLLDVRVRGGKGRTIVEVVADTAEGIGVDQLARLSRELGFLFDTHEAIPGTYTLNATSPGAKEPLFAHQYPRHVGRTLDVRLTPVADEAPAEQIKGTLTAATDESITLELSDGTERSFPISTIQQARVVLPW